MEARPLRSILRGSLDGDVVVVDVCGGDIGLSREAGCCFSLAEDWVEGSGWPEMASNGVVFANSWVMSRLFNDSIALSSSSCFRLITPSVQWSAPTGRIAFGCTLVVVPFVSLVDSVSSGDTSSRKDLMLASS